MLVHIAYLCIEAQNDASTAECDEHRALQSQQCPSNAAYAHRADNAVYDKHIARSSLCLTFICESLDRLALQ